mmetsp:Transcript_7010/g.7125  ORF Transcript_7010/g.7125 Transcript_7010/m.7125 type:complete len:257 (-) Transcript_7010:518-1288(-)
MGRYLIFCFTIISILVSALAFTPVANAFSVSRTTSKRLIRSQFSVLNDKKTKTEAKGFAPKKVKVVKVVEESEDEDNEVGEEEERKEQNQISISQAIFQEAGKGGETDAEAIFKKYGIKDGESNATKIAAQKKKNAKNTKNSKGKVEETPFGQSVLANFPAKVQLQIDNTLVGLVFASLTFVVLCGIGISTKAFEIVRPDVKIPVGVDRFITDFLDPAFTPSFLIFFFFSITFGIFKFAQVSSDQTVYKEDIFGEK